MKKILKYISFIMGYKISNIRLIPKQLLNKKNLIRLEFDHILSKYLLAQSNANNITFIQVGGFDGIERDPLRKYLVKYNWNGVIMEPQPEPYSNLLSLYKNNPNILLLNLALSDQNHKMILYVLDCDDFPYWAKGLASFDKSNIIKHQNILIGLESNIKELEINTITFEDVLNRKAIDKLDLLQIDTEGYDAKIIQMFPFEKLKPSIIHFESKHIPKKEMEAVLELLLSEGYIVATEEEDTVAILKSVA